MVSIDKIGENVRFSLLGRQNACVRSLAVAHVSLHPHPYCGGSTLEELRGAFETEKGSMYICCRRRSWSPDLKTPLRSLRIWNLEVEVPGNRGSGVSRLTSHVSAIFSIQMDGWIDR
jgi:hypothetical protein